MKKAFLWRWLASCWFLRRPMRSALPAKQASITPTLGSASAPSPPVWLFRNWLHSDNDGDAAGLGLGLNIPLGPFLATVGGKGVYTNPKQGDEGYAAAVGGGLQWKIGDSFRLYGDYYYSPDSLSSGIDSYQEANVGASWTIMRPLSIQAGYRYLNLAGKDGNRDNTIADGQHRRQRQLLISSGAVSSCRARFSSSASRFAL